MAKVRKKKKKTKLKKQSLARNIALLLLSVVILSGASILFSLLNTRPEYSYEPIEKNLSKIVSRTSAKLEVQTEKAEPQKGSANSFDYSYWDILLLQDTAADAAESWSVQIGAFSSRDAAQEYADGIKGKTRLGCTVEARDKTYIVRWGSFRTRETAERHCSTLSGRLQKECVVVKL